MKPLQKLSTSQFKLGVYAGNGGQKRYAEKLRYAIQKSRSYRGIVMLNKDSTLTPRVPKTQCCTRQGAARDPLHKLQRQQGPEGLCLGASEPRTGKMHPGQGERLMAATLLTLFLK